MIDGVEMITNSDIENAQREWGEGIVRIASSYRDGGDYVGVAEKHIHSLYAYGSGPVLFKPTMASEEQFRPTFQSALSYFVASNSECLEDSGFALKGWTKVRFENAGVIIDGIYAIAMGNYFFTDQGGLETKVEYTFGYIQDEEGRLRIQLHHSSIPASTY